MVEEASIPPRRVAEALQFLFEVYDEDPHPTTLAEWIEVLEKGGSEGAYPDVAAALRANVSQRWR